MTGSTSHTISKSTDQIREACRIWLLPLDLEVLEMEGVVDQDRAYPPRWKILEGTAQPDMRSDLSEFPTAGAVPTERLGDLVLSGQAGRDERKAAGEQRAGSLTAADPGLLCCLSRVDFACHLAMWTH